MTTAFVQTDQLPPWVQDWLFTVVPEKGAVELIANSPIHRELCIRLGKFVEVFPAHLPAPVIRELQQEIPDSLPEKYGESFKIPECDPAFAKYFASLDTYYQSLTKRHPNPLK